MWLSVVDIDGLCHDWWPCASDTTPFVSDVDNTARLEIMETLARLIPFVLSLSGTETSYS